MQILAHRGGCGDRFPENSLAAFDAGLNDGCDRLELDVHLTHDGVVVVHHDPTLLRTCGDPRPIARVTGAQISELRLRDSSGAPTEHPIPTLAQLIDRFPDAPLNIDLKGTAAELVTETARILAERHAVERTIVGSFHAEQLRRFRATLPSATTSAHPGEVRAMLLAHLVNLPISNPAAVLQVPRRHNGIPLVTARFVRYVHRLGKEIHVWTVNDAGEAFELADLGVDGLVTDDVALIGAALGKRR